MSSRISIREIRGRGKKTYANLKRYPHVIVLARKISHLLLFLLFLLFISCLATLANTAFFFPREISVQIAPEKARNENNPRHAHAHTRARNVANIYIYIYIEKRNVYIYIYHARAYVRTHARDIFFSYNDIGAGIVMNIRLATRVQRRIE